MQHANDRNDTKKCTGYIGGRPRVKSLAAFAPGEVTNLILVIQSASDIRLHNDKKEKISYPHATTPPRVGFEGTLDNHSA